MPRTSPYSLTLTDAERTELEARARRYTSPYSEVVRAKIVLYAAEGLGNDEIAARLDTPRQVVSKWRKRFFDERLAGLWRASNLPDCGPNRVRFGKESRSWHENTRNTSPSSVTR